MPTVVFEMYNAKKCLFSVRRPKCAYGCSQIATESVIGYLVWVLWPFDKLACPHCLRRLCEIVSWLIRVFGMQNAKGCLFLVWRRLPGSLDPKWGRKKPPNMVGNLTRIVAGDGAREGPCEFGS